MKNLTILLLLLAIVIGCRPGSSGTQGSDAIASDSTCVDVEITVTVMTDSLYKAKPPNQDSLKNYIQISDGVNTSPFRADHKGFITDVVEGCSVTWIAVPYSGDTSDSVRIQSMMRKPGPPTTKPVVNDRSNPDNRPSNRIEAKVNQNPTQDTMDYQITIFLKRDGNNGPPRYVIDPKLNANPKLLGDEAEEGN